MSKVDKKRAAALRKKLKEMRRRSKIVKPAKAPRYTFTGEEHIVDAFIEMLNNYKPPKDLQ